MARGVCGRLVFGDDRVVAVESKSAAAAAASKYFIVSTPWLSAMNRQASPSLRTIERMRSRVLTFE